EAHVAGGGRLLVEGGEVAADAAGNPGYPSFCSDVLHVELWKYNSGGDLVSFDALHPVTTTPNQIDLIRFTAIGTGDQDACIPTADAVTVCDWEYRSGVSSVIAYDDNEEPAGGQIVFFEFDYTAGEMSGMVALLENAVAYLTAIEGTGVPEEGPAALPANFVLRGIAPNPFNPVTSVSYGLPSRGRVAIRVHDVSGRLVRTLVDGERDAGYSEAVWDGRDDRGLEVASGVYFCRMEAGAFSSTAKMVLLK
ncbi:MAG TPA: FlgD immunoglobulin-like domain containing protein, partial [bacterium]|nr:FlgD immunoglobulin-like domain containing protein [bacterium]